MILERTPRLENLIDSAIVKCEIAVAKKKEEAIESLRLARTGPTTMRKGFGTERICRGSPESLMQGFSMQRVANISNNYIKKKTQNHWRVKRVRPYKGRAHSKVSIIADSLPSNSEEQSELFLPRPKLPSDPLRPNPKPPNQDNGS